ERRGERHGSDRGRNRRGEPRSETAESDGAARHHVRGNRRLEDRAERPPRAERDAARPERALAGETAAADDDAAPRGNRGRRGRGRNRRDDNAQQDAPMSEQESMVAALAETVASALPATQGPAIAASLAEQAEAGADTAPAAEAADSDNAEGTGDPERK